MAAAAPVRLPGAGWRVGKFFLGLLLLPVGWVLTATFFENFARANLGGRRFWASEGFWFFALGVVLWSILFLGLPQPSRLALRLRFYVFGHEFTHALWVWAGGGRVSAFRVGRDGGYIVADRVGVFTSLAPYFFPLYSVVVVVGWGLAGVWWGEWMWGEAGRRVLFALLGATWAFHFTFTLWMIPKDQPGPAPARDVLFPGRHLPRQRARADDPVHPRLPRRDVGGLRRGRGEPRADALAQNRRRTPALVGQAGNRSRRRARLGQRVPPAPFGHRPRDDDGRLPAPPPGRVLLPPRRPTPGARRADPLLRPGRRSRGSPAPARVRGRSRRRGGLRAVAGRERAPGREVGVPRPEAPAEAGGRTLPRRQRGAVPTDGARVDRGPNPPRAGRHEGGSTLTRAGPGLVFQGTFLGAPGGPGARRAHPGTSRRSLLPG